MTGLITYFLYNKSKCPFDKVHGTLLQCLWHLPYLDGVLFMVVHPLSNIAMYHCILLNEGDDSTWKSAETPARAPI